MKFHTLVKLCLGVVSCLPATDAFTTVNKNSRMARAKTTSTSSQLRMDAGIGDSLSHAWASYNVALEANPLVVKSITAGIILGAADLAGQTLESIQKDEEVSSIDVARTARFAFFGFILQAPWNHFYYQMLDSALPPTPEPWTPTTAIKTFIDQGVQAPIFTVLIFVFLGFLEGKSTEDVKKQLNNDYTDTMLANWKLWVPATVVNIAFVPPLFRVLYLNCVFFFWSIFLSLKLNEDKQES